MPAITFTVFSTYSLPGEKAYAGTLDVDGYPDWSDGPADRAVIDMLEVIFARGGNDPNAATLPGWRQPSVSVGDVIVWRITGEGVAVTYAAECAHIGWTRIDEDDPTFSRHREIAMDRFADIDPAYDAQRQAHRARKAALRERMHRNLSI